MLVRTTLLIGLFGMIGLTTNAQLFETRSTRYSGTEVLEKLNNSGTEVQNSLRDSIIKNKSSSLSPTDVIETYFDDYHMGLVIYRDQKAHELIGFWDPQGNEVSGGILSNGSGIIKTPFNPNLITKFKSESVTYTSGAKNGPVFYYCDCAKVLRKGNFQNNQKEGLWLEFKPNGDFVKQKRIKVVEEVIKVDKPPVDDKWLQPTHCMMKNPNEINIQCPKN
ncbi:MAG: hypothetical protein HRT57_01880 [Crocinitomicaceae bacterium]|nr:hypothetical protein [Crocinitomicaceae bacterium]